MTNMDRTCMLSLSLALGALACGLDDSEKTACAVQQDCLSGFVCVDQECRDPRDQPAQPDGGDVVVDPPPGDGAVFEYGTVEPLTALSAGMAAVNYDTLAGLTTASGGLGCALVATESAAPGTTAALVYTRIEAESGDDRCPSGVYSITNDPSYCGSLIWDSELRGGCALYKRWDSAGNQVANRLAIGGYASVTQVYRTESDYGCNVELSFSFAGGTTIQRSYSFDYNPFASDDAFCAQ